MILLKWIGVNRESHSKVISSQKYSLTTSLICSDGSDKLFGFENFGNTCYANSVLQTLYYSKPFRDGVIRYPKPIDLFPVPLNSKSNSNSFNKYSFKSSFLNLSSFITLSTSNCRKSSSYSHLSTKRTRSFSSATFSNKHIIFSTDEISSSNNVEIHKKKLFTKKFNVNIDSSYCSMYGMRESLFTCVRDIFAGIIQSHVKDGICSPTKLIEVLRRENKHFRSNLHQDAHEFLNYLLNVILESVEEHDRSNVSINDTISYNNEKNQSISTKWVHSIFEGILTTETRCLTCENVTSRDESFLDLSIDINRNTSITSCLDSFFAPEMLYDKNKFHCDFCGDLQEAEKHIKIKHLPEILTLHLKRFKYIEENGSYKFSKLFYTVVYPYYLRLSNTTNDVNDPDRLYELYAVVVHLGSGPYHGHYVSVIKTESGWTLFDDERVEPVNEAFVRRFFGDLPGEATAYVLFYQTVDIASHNSHSQESSSSEQNTDSAFEFSNTHVQPSDSIPIEPVLVDKVDNDMVSLLDQSISKISLQPPKPALHPKLHRNMNNIQLFGNTHDSVYPLPKIKICTEIFDKKIQAELDERKDTFVTTNRYFYL